MSGPLGRHWEGEAERWAAWARRPDHDVYWRFSGPRFLEIVPPAGRATLDLGCGEGRLARDLAAIGHAVTAIDQSPTMVRLAREAAPGLRVDVGDAAALPYPDGAFDLVVAFMTLMDMDDMPGAVREAARVLEPGGRFCFAVVHPLNSAGAFADDDDPESPFVLGGSYLETSFYEDHLARDGLAVDFRSVHRPLEGYARALEDAGLLVETLREPAMDPAARSGPRWLRWRRVPLFLLGRARRPA